MRPAKYRIGELVLERRHPSRSSAAVRRCRYGPDVQSDWRADVQPRSHDAASGQKDLPKWPPGPVICSGVRTVKRSALRPPGQVGDTARSVAHGPTMEVAGRILEWRI